MNDDGERDLLDDYDDTPEDDEAGGSGYRPSDPRRNMSPVRAMLLAGVGLAAVGLVVGVATDFGKVVWFFAAVVWILATLVWLGDSYRTGTSAGKERPLAVPLGAAVVSGLAILLLTFVSFAGSGSSDEPSVRTSGTATRTPSSDDRTPDGSSTSEATDTETPGNGSPTPASTRTRTPTETATRNAGGQTYTVQAGDTLSGIAAQFGVELDALMEANNITDPNTVIVGQELIIPE